MTLDTGAHFTFANLSYATIPAIELRVRVTYSEQGGQKAAHMIDVVTIRQ